jgi:hypothetical protein
MTTMTPDGRTVQVVYQDRRNAAVMTAVVELTGGYTEEHIPLRLATADQWGAAPDDFRVIRVLDVTGDDARDEAALLDVRAELLDRDALKLRAMLGDPERAHVLTDVGIDGAWINEYYEAEADRLRAQAVKIGAA